MGGGPGGGDGPGEGGGDGPGEGGGGPGGGVSRTQHLPLPVIEIQVNPGAHMSKAPQGFRHLGSVIYVYKYHIKKINTQIKRLH